MRLCFIDVETTGLHPMDGDAICEIAAIIFSEDGKLVSRYIRVINPRRSIPMQAVAVHGISNALVANAYFFEDVVDEFTRYIAGTILLGYNINFDISFLKVEFERVGRHLPVLKTEDVLIMARKFLPGLHSYKLSSVAKELGFSYKNFHWAETDVMATAYIYFYIKRHCIDKNK